MGTVHALPKTENSTRTLPKFDIPSKPYDRQVWFEKNFITVVEKHVTYLLRVCPHLKSRQSITFSDINSEGVMHVHYGKISIYFPIEKMEEFPEKLSDWMRHYELEIDNEIVEISTRINRIQTSVQENIEEVSIWNSFVNTALPPIIRHESTNSVVTTEHKEIKRSIRIRRRMSE